MKMMKMMKGMIMMIVTISLNKEDHKDPAMMILINHDLNHNPHDHNGSNAMMPISNFVTMEDNDEDALAYRAGVSYDNNDNNIEL